MRGKRVNACPDYVRTVTGAGTGFTFFFFRKNRRKNPRITGGALKQIIFIHKTAPINLFHTQYMFLYKPVLQKTVF
jgi:hypothetical protein